VELHVLNVGNHFLAVQNMPQDWEGAPCYQAMIARMSGLALPAHAMVRVPTPTVQECNICLMEVLDPSDIRGCPGGTCNVFYHKACLELWLEKYARCPTCRTETNRALVASPARHLSPVTLDQEAEPVLLAVMLNESGVGAIVNASDVLRAMVLSAAFIHVVPAGQYQGMSPLLFAMSALTPSHDALRAAIANETDLLGAMVLSPAFIHVVPAGRFQGCSPLWFAMSVSTLSHDALRVAIANDPDLVRTIAQSPAFIHVVPAGRYQGSSPSSLLTNGTAPSHEALRAKIQLLGLG
jgi:hypothetical protein